MRIGIYGDLDELYGGPTISLFKIKDGDCVGGYKRAKW